MGRATWERELEARLEGISIRYGHNLFFFLFLFTILFIILLHFLLIFFNIIMINWEWVLRIYMLNFIDFQILLFIYFVVVDFFSIHVGQFWVVVALFYIHGVAIWKYIHVLNLLEVFPTCSKLMEDIWNGASYTYFLFDFLFVFFFLSFSLYSTHFCTVPLFWLLPEMQPQVIHPKLLVVFRHWQMGATSKQFCELLDLKKDWLDDTIVGFDTSSPRRHDGEVKHENQSSRRKRGGTEWKRASLLRLVRCCLRRWGKLSCLYWQPSRCQSIHRGRCMWALWKQDSRGGSLEILHFGLHSFILGSICGRVG